jgi:GT2 family glycosyltransferase
LECLASLRATTYARNKVIVLDNASNDGSVEAILCAYPEVQVVALKDNLGYAGNNNVGLRLALEQGADWTILLNEDTVMAPDCLARMVDAGEEDSRIGIVGPMVYHYDPPNDIQSAGGRLGRYWESSHIGANEPDCGQFDRIREVDWISGCCIMLRRQVVEQIGPLDARYFYYWEETELCIRASRQGWRIVHVPSAKIWHKGVQPEYKPSASVTYYATRNRLLTLSKHHAPVVVRLVAWVQLLRTLASWTVRPKWRHMRAHRDAMWQGMGDYFLRRWGRMHYHGLPPETVQETRLAGCQ